MNHKKTILLWSYFSFIVNGILGVMTGAILIYLIDDYGLSYSEAGFLVTVQSLGNLFAGLLSGFIIYQIGRRNSMLLFSVAFAIGFGGIVFTDSVFILYLLFTISGIGWGICNNIIHILVTEASEGSPTGITVLHTSFAVGAFISPLLVSGVFSIGLTWKTAVLIVAVLCIVLFLKFLHIPVSTPQKEKKQDLQEGKRENLFAFLKEPRYYICILLYLTYIGVEASLNTWLITFLEKVGIMTLKKAQFMVSLFWFIVIFSRLFNTVLSKYIKRDKLLSMQIIFLFIILTCLIFNRNEWLAIVLIPLLGLTIAGISPSNAANAREYISGAGFASGIIFAGGSLGSALIPFLVGYTAEYAGIFRGMFILLVLLGIFFMLSLANQRLLKKEIHNI